MRPRVTSLPPLPLVATAVVVAAAALAWVELAGPRLGAGVQPVDTVDLPITAVDDGGLTWAEVAEVWVRWAVAGLAVVTLVALVRGARRTAIGVGAAGVVAFAAPASQATLDGVLTLTPPFWLALWGSAVLLGCALEAARSG